MARFGAAGVALAAGLCVSTAAAGTSGAPISVQSTFVGNGLRLDGVTFERGGAQVTVNAAAIGGVTVTSFGGSELPFENTLLSTPLNGDGTPNAPAAGQRAAVLSDAFINSAIQNPNGSSGIGLRFDVPAINGVGADLILIDVGAAPGAPVPGPAGPGTLTSPGGDPFTLAGMGADAGLSASFTSDQYLQIGSDTLLSGNTGFFNNLDAFPASDLAELESTTLNAIPLPPTFPLTAYAILIDLSDLGFAEGAVVSELRLLKSGSDFGVDPGFIGALSTVPGPGPLAALAGLGVVSAARRRR